VRGPVEALEAALGGAHIADVEFPASALGTPYPLNIRAVRERLRGRGFGGVRVSTNIGEEQAIRATACQSALGVAAAGADLIKFGLANLDYDASCYLGRSIVRTVRHWYPRKKLYPAVFADNNLRTILDPLSQGPKLAGAIKADGLLVDTFNKDKSDGLLDLITVGDLRSFVRSLHRRGQEAWIAGSLRLEQLPVLWKTGVDVICVRGAACAPGTEGRRFGKVRASLVSRLSMTIPEEA
jgi:uncharacterized protein (UPF0264 family)